MPWAETLVSIPNRALFGSGCYLRPGRYLGPMNEFFHGYQHSMFYMCACMHTIQYVWSCEYTQPPPPPPPWAFTRTWVTTRVKRVDVLYLGAYTEGGRYFVWALLRAFTVLVRKRSYIISVKHASYKKKTTPVKQAGNRQLLGICVAHIKVRYSTASSAVTSPKGRDKTNIRLVCDEK